MKQIGIAALALLATGGAQGQALLSEPLDNIVAVVEEDVILRSELDAATQNVINQIRASNGEVPPRTQLEERVLNQLVMVELQLQRAEATGIRISDQEIDASMQRLAAQNGISLDQLRVTLESEGFSYAEFRQDMRDELMTQRLTQRVAASRVDVSETEVDIYLAGQSTRRGEYRLSHILIGLPEGAGPEAIQAARLKANEVRAEIEAGADFASAAVKYSDAQDALQGGDLGWRTANQVPTVLDEQIGGMQAGDITQPIRSASGFHIFRVAEFRDQAPVMVEEYRARHIMIEVNELVSANEAQATIENIHDRVINGEEFEELAKQYSDDSTTANLGGDMGWFAPAQYSPRIQETLASLEDGDTSQPFQTDQGWHIIKRIETRNQDRTDLFERAQAREAIRQRKAKEEIELWLRELRDEAYVELRV